jgi:hypothetical protein
MRRGRVLRLSELRERLASKARAGKPLEPPLEIGVTIRAPRLLVYVLPVLESELEMQVECDRGRNAVLRAVDAGLHELGRRRDGSRAFRVLLLYWSADRTPRSVKLVHRYRARPQEMARALGHRRRLSASALRRVLGLARWEAFPRRLSAIQRQAKVEPTEMVILNRLLGYFEELGIGSGS